MFFVENSDLLCLIFVFTVMSRVFSIWLICVDCSVYLNCMYVVPFEMSASSALGKSRHASQQLSK